MVVIIVSGDEDDDVIEAILVFSSITNGDDVVDSNDDDCGATIGRSIEYVGMVDIRCKNSFASAVIINVPNTVWVGLSTVVSFRVVIPNAGVASNRSWVNKPIRSCDILFGVGPVVVDVPSSTHNFAGNKRLPYRNATDCCISTTSKDGIVPPYNTPVASSYCVNDERLYDGNGVSSLLVDVGAVVVAVVGSVIYSKKR